MYPIIDQIAPVAAVRAPAVPLRQGSDGAQPYGSAQARKNAQQASEKRPAVSVPSAPGIRLTVKSDTHEVIATLVDTETNEVIREIPGEETRRAAEVIRGIAGQLLDKHA